MLRSITAFLRDLFRPVAPHDDLRSEYDRIRLKAIRDADAFYEFHDEDPT